MSTAKVYMKEFALLNYEAQNANDHTSNPVRIPGRSYFLMKFEDLPESMQFKRIVDIRDLTLYVTKFEDPDEDLRPSVTVSTDDLSLPFDPEAATYKNYAGNLDGSSLILTDKIDSTGNFSPEYFYASGGALNYGFLVYVQYSRTYLSVTTSGTRRPYWTVEVDDSDTLGVILQKFSPESGTVSRKSPTTFSWQVSLSNSVSCSPRLTATSMLFRWREGADGDIHEVDVPYNGKFTNSVTIPADTFPAAEIQWQVEAVANSGVVTTSDWMTVSTLDATPTAKVISPDNTFVDATIDNTFMWSHIIETGTAQTKAELQQSADALIWTSLATVTGAETQWVCPANTLTSSIKYWRVRTYNADDVASEWSENAQIVVISAPPTPVVQIQTLGPRPEFSWQTTGQQACEVEIIGVYESGTIYGSSQRWACPIYLPDGDYTIRVRAQNEYGLWSGWGSAAFYVTNTPGSDIKLSVQANHTALLQWETDGDYDFYLVYRDGIPIEKLSFLRFEDMLSVGRTIYQIRGCYDDSGNYGLSSEIEVDICPDTIMLADISAGTWLSLPYSMTVPRETSREFSRSVGYLPLSGVKFPVAEAGDNYTDALHIEAAFADIQSGLALEALVGKLICIKTPSGDMSIGYMDALEKTNSEFASNYAFAVQQIHYQQEVQL